ncbi:NAD(P)H-binding protein [Actinoallomurus purpureus]|uniref:SDR family oxidoreductase n=1 Tax=Actinoallomurus purpureus TaxID=478114 RepID=UPI002093731D|nr:NAD-dependent epimerase/dehydratase family protein [Actinoallomurus purpureus]MCO6006906.1 NAD(P)H-binding protein [Actinoallomurus purpureus]
MSQMDLVTGAYGYSGTYLRQRLETAGHTVRTLTNHPTPDADIEVFPLDFGDPEALAEAFDGVTTFYNTYWSRYAPAGTSHLDAVTNTATLLEAAARMGVERVVHLSITNPDSASFYTYYQGKAAVEDLVTASGMSHAIVRPSVIFGGDDILINNIAWLLRRFPMFAIPGTGRYRLRPVQVQDLADLCVRLGAERTNTVTDAIGPESFGFEDLVGTIAQAIGVPFRPVHLPAAAVSVLLRGLSMLTRDVVLTRDEIEGLMAELVMVDGEATCPTLLTGYLHENAGQIGRRYQSELARRKTPARR